METKANRYTFVWVKHAQGYQQLLAEKVAAFFKEIEQINAEENACHGD